MESQKVKVLFEPSGRGVFVLPGTILLEAAARAGFIIQTPCGGSGRCGKCAVRVTAGDCPPCDEERSALTPAQIEDGCRLACQCHVAADLTIEIPQTSLFQTGQRILAADTGEEVAVQPRIRKRVVRLDPPTRDDAVSDTERLKRALGDVTPDISVLRALPAALRRATFEVTVTSIDDRVIDVSAGDAGDGYHGIAFDIGTTTLVGTLIDLSTGVDLAVASTINPQTSFGDDVVSRIRKCRDEEDGLAQLHDAVIEAVAALVEEVLGKANVDRRSVCEVVFAGNTTMQQILCGISPAALGEMPFVPAFREPLWLRPTDLGLNINPAGDVHVFPQIGGFVGGDTVAGIVATRLDRQSEPSLLVDVGTNGEIVLAHDGKLVATSVAAGPAFEGARITNGMRATSGAIEKVVLDGDVRLNVIGNAKPSGLCGTGLIDVTAELLHIGILDPTGRLLGPDELPADVPDAIRARVVPNGDHHDFLLVDQAATGTGEPLYLYQKDIRELQLANGAIRAGISILLGMEGIDAGQLGSVLLAGAFGNFIRRRNARRIGMLPQIPSERIRFVGNAASFGAKRVLLSVEEKEYASRVMRETRHVDLSMDPGFQAEFGMAMLFPEGD